MSSLLGLLSRSRRNNRQKRSGKVSVFQAESLEARELLSTVPGEFIVYKLAGGDIYKIAAQANAQPQDLSTALNALSTGTEDANVNISPNGQWLAIDTDRFGIASGNSGPGLAVVSADLKSGAAVVSGGSYVYPEGITAISSDGNLVVYSAGGGPHVRDLFAITRSSGGSWGTAQLLTANSPYQYNSEPALSADGTKVLFDGGPQPDKDGSVAVCEVSANGQGFKTVVTAANAPASSPFDQRINCGHFAADGTIIFEASSSVTGDLIWKLPAGATTAVRIAPDANDEVNPIGLPDGRTVSLWLNRVGNTSGAHELTLRDSSGKYLFTLQPNVDIDDIGMGAGGIASTNQASTTTTLAGPASPTVFGQSVIFTATVSVVAPGTGNPTGSVTFMDGSKTLGSGTLSTENGVTTASLTTSTLPAGSHSIIAIYSGDANVAGSTSTALSATVNKASTTTTLTPSANAPVAGQTVTLTAIVSAVSPGSGKPAKTVTFKDGTVILGTVPLRLVNGASTATFTTSALKLGTHGIIAIYSGGPNYQSSTSAAASITVGKDSTTTKIKASANPVAVKSPVTFTATVTVVAPGGGIPTGTVIFKEGNKTLGTGRLVTVNGVTAAKFTTSSLAVGKHLITAFYGSDSRDKASHSGTLTLTVRN